MLTQDSLHGVDGRVRPIRDRWRWEAEPKRTQGVVYW